MILRSEWDVMPFLERGELVRILPEYSQSANIWAVYQEPLYQSVKLQVCVEYLMEYCQRLFGHLDENVAERKSEGNIAI